MPLAEAPAPAASGPWPRGFGAETMPVTGGTQYVPIGGNGPAVVFLPGFAGAGHWIMEKQPEQAVAVITAFLGE